MAKRDDVLVTTDWLADHLNDPGIRVVEVDEDTDAYGRGHIPGAVEVNWNTDLQDPLRRDFIDPEQFAKLQDSLGITPTTTVVLYGGNNNWFAAYAYWYYKVYGHGPVQLLDRGRKSWELEGRDLTTDTSPVSAYGGYRENQPDFSIRALTDEQLTELYGAQGLDPGKDVVAYCRIGERSAHTWFALHELLGYPNVRNYDGSWTEWGSLVGVPIER